MNMDEYCVNWMNTVNTEHCQETWMNTVCVATPGTWATQVEVIATATIFRVPVYFCLVSSTSLNCYRWNVIHPLDEAKYELQIMVG